MSRSSETKQNETLAPKYWEILPNGDPSEMKKKSLRDSKGDWNLLCTNVMHGCKAAPGR